MIRIAVLVALACSASAQIKTLLVEVPTTLGPGYETFDLVVVVPHGNDWTSTSMKAEMSGGVFFQHPLGGNTAPDTTLFGLAPTLKWDTFVTFAESWPNTPTQGKTPGFAGQPTFNPTFINATWFDVPPNGGPGPWVVARVSVADLQPGWQLKLSGAHTFIIGEPLHPYSFIVPEPASAAAFLVGLVLVARRMRRDTR